MCSRADFQASLRKEESEGVYEQLEFVCLLCILKDMFKIIQGKISFIDTQATQSKAMLAEPGHTACSASKQLRRQLEVASG